MATELFVFKYYWLIKNLKNLHPYLSATHSKNSISEAPTYQNTYLKRRISFSVGAFEFEKVKNVLWKKIVTGDHFVDLKF